MSLLDQVRKLEQQVTDRLRELEPLILEYGQLRRLAERLGITDTPASPETADDAAAPARRERAKAGAAKRPAAKRTGKRPPARKAAAKRAAKPRAAKATAGRRAAAARPGQRPDDVLRLVAEQPGITVREIGQRLGVDATGLYRVVKRLSDEGRLRKDGPRLHPAETPATATPAQGTAEPSGGEPASPASEPETAATAADATAPPQT